MLLWCHRRLMECRGNLKSHKSLNDILAQPLPPTHPSPIFTGNGKQDMVLIRFFQLSSICISVHLRIGSSTVALSPSA